jgi:hypothetical protein
LNFPEGIFGFSIMIFNMKKVEKLLK